MWSHSSVLLLILRDNIVHKVTRNHLKESTLTCYNFYLADIWKVWLFTMKMNGLKFKLGSCHLLPYLAFLARSRGTASCRKWPGITSCNLQWLATILSLEEVWKVGFYTVKMNCGALNLNFREGTQFQCGWLVSVGLVQCLTQTSLP